MKAGGGKRKGGSYERAIAKKLSLALTDDQEEYAVWRSSSSGAHATRLKKSGKQSDYSKKHSGDLVQSLDKGIYPNLDCFFDTFFVETKHYKKVSLYPPFTKEFELFLDQLDREADESGKDPCFIIKQNNRKDLMIICYAWDMPEVRGWLSIPRGNRNLFVYILDDVLPLLSKKDLTFY